LQLKVVAQNEWTVLLQIGGATVAVLALLCVGAVLSALIDWALE